jgi:hypothetical protein
MWWLNRRAAFKIGDGACHPEQPMYGSRRKAELLEGCFEERSPSSSQIAGILEGVSAEGGIVGDGEAVLESGALERSGSLDASGNSGRRFSGPAVELLERDRWHFDVQIDPIQERP